MWDSLVVWLWLGATIVLCCSSAGNVIAGYFVHKTNMEDYFPERWVKAFAHKDMPLLRARWRLKTAGACSLVTLILFIFTALQTADAKELIATTYASSFEALGALLLNWDGAWLPSFDEVVNVLSHPVAELSNAFERVGNMSRYANFDPAYFSEGVQALTAINLILNCIKLLATFGRKLFVLVDVAKRILKTYCTDDESASEGDDGTVQVYEAMTDSRIDSLALVVILDLLSKQKVQGNLGEEDATMSYANLLLQEELKFDNCNLIDADLAGLVALVTHPDMTVKSRSLRLDGNKLVTTRAWKSALPGMLTNGSLTSLDVCNNNITGDGAQQLAAAVLGKQTVEVFCQIPLKELRADSLTSLDLTEIGIGVPGALVLAGLLRAVRGSLTSLALKKTEIGESGAAAIGDALKVNDSLTEVDLDGFALPLKRLKGTDPVESLDLSEKGLAFASAFVIASLIGVNGSLTECNLKDNNLSNAGWCAIFNALRDNKDNKIAKWDLSSEGIDVAVAKSLAAYVTVSGSLTSLDLGENNIGPDGGAAVAKALKVNDSLTSLDLHNNTIGTKGGEAIAKALAVNGSLASLDVRNCDITGVGAQQLAAVVLGSQTLHTFCQIPLKELRADTLTTLDLKNKGIDVPGALVLATIIRTVSSSLTEVDLDDFALPVKQLKGTDPVESLDLSQKGLGFTSAVVIASLIGVNGSLKSLDLHGNDIGKEGGLAFAEAFRVNSSKRKRLTELYGQRPVGSLTELYLGGNPIGPEGVRALTEVLKDNGSKLTKVG